MIIPTDAKKVLVLQHSNPEHLGLIAEALRHEQVGYTYLRPDLGQSIPNTLDGYHGLIVMGGPQGVYEENIYPYLRPEKALIRSAIQTQRPVLGVCLGSQLIAEVLGSRVYPGSSFELGWKKVAISQEITGDYVLGHLPSEITPMHWHGDVFDLPDQALTIGSSVISQVQGFSWKGRVYGLLFHLEMTAEQISEMVVDFPNDLSRSGVKYSEIMDVVTDNISILREHSFEVFRRWATLL